MPHATLPSPGFQALILCGPGVSLNTFTSNPKEFPKALVPIANRPMVWYPIEWCSRMGISNITLITPPESKAAIEAALSMNPHFTGLPKPDVLAPADLDQNTGTAELFRLPEVQAVVTGDFIVLPCDLVCELDGLSLLQEWMVLEGGLGGASGGLYDGRQHPMVIGGEKSGRRGGLGVWYSTKSEDSVKKEQTDFVATTPLPPPIVPPPQSSLRRDVSKLVYAIPTDTLKDITEEKEGFPIRHALFKRHGRIKMYMKYRDAHIYFFPYWILEMIKNNKKLDSVGEDVLGWWAKAGWQNGLGDKLGLRDILDAPRVVSSPDMSGNGNPLDEDIDLASYITTRSSNSETNSVNSTGEVPLASRVRDPNAVSKPLTSLTSKSPLPIPPILAYIQPSTPSAPLIRRVDTSALLLNISLKLAKLPALADAPPAEQEHSPFAHQTKIHPTTTIPQQCRVDTSDSLVAENVTISERCNIKETVIGAGCTVGTGAKLTKCILMDGAVVGDFVTLVGCTLGRRCRVEGGPKEDKEKTSLKDCEVQEGYVVPWGTEEKNHQYMVFEGLSDEENGGFGSDGGEDVEAFDD